MAVIFLPEIYISWKRCIYRYFLFLSIITAVYIRICCAHRVSNQTKMYFFAHMLVKIELKTECLLILYEFSSVLTSDQIAYGLPTMDVSETVLSSVCPVNLITECPPGKFRTFSGHCNNVNNPLWGAAYEPMQRFLKPSYADGELYQREAKCLLTGNVWYIGTYSEAAFQTKACHYKAGYDLEIGKPRASTNGSPLPSSRVVSQAIFTEPKDGHTLCSMMVAQWAMFIYEDLVHTGATTLYRG